MSKLDNYYSDIAAEIIKLIKQNDFKKAHALVIEELDQPYMPFEHYANFIKIKEDIELKIQEQKYLNKNNLSKLAIWNKIFEKKDHLDFVYLNILFEKHSDKFEEEDFVFIKKVFKNTKISNDQKCNLLAMLVNYEIDYSFDYYNNYTHKTTTFNAKSYHTSSKQTQFQNLSNMLENTFLKDPSKLQIAINLAQVLYVEFAPEELPLELIDVNTKITNVVNFLFGDSIKIDENDNINKILLKYVK